MSLYKAKPGFLRIAMKVLVIFMTVALTACGFRPLYAPETAGQSGQIAPGILASIQIDEPKNRFSQLLRNELLFKLGGDNETAAPRYRLSYVVTRSDSSASYDPINKQATTTLVNTTASYQLYRKSDNMLIHSGKSYRSVSLDRSFQRFANIRAGKDAEKRASKLLAEDIKAQLIAFLSARQSTSQTDGRS